MKILIFGGNGYVGSLLAREIPGTVVTASRLDSAADAIAKHEPDAVVNAAGRTGRPNVDWCESHPIETWSDNALGAMTLARACHAQGVRLVHIGSACVFFPHGGAFGGGEIFDERSTPNPRTVYTRSKAAADAAIVDMGGCVIRIRMPLSVEPHPRNYITKIRSYDNVVAAFPTVTWLEELPAVVMAAIDRRAVGVFHAVNPGAVDTVRLARPGSNIISEASLRSITVCERSHASVVSRRMRELGVELSDMSVALPSILERYDALERKVA